MEELTKEAITRMRDLGAAAYLRGYVHLMVRELEIDESDTEGMNHMLLLMVEPLNVATEAIWRAMMKETPEEMEKVLERFKAELDKVRQEVT